MAAVGRLENIIARNQGRNRSRERIVVTFGFGAIVLLILVLMIFTDLGLPPSAPGAHPAVPAPAPAAPRVHGGKRVEGVLLRTEPAGKPASR